MRYKEPFTLFPRKTKNGKDIWYFRTYDESGARTTARSTGRTSKTAARQYVVDILTSGNILPKKNPTFKEYVQDWWIWDRCAYVLSKRARGSRIGQTYVRTNRMYLDSHILPSLGKYRISAITPRIIERMVMDLRNKISKYGRPLSPTSVNQVLSCLKIIFREAVRLGDLARDPTISVMPLKENRKTKSFLSPDEARQLFEDTRIGEIWDGNLAHYTLNLVAASTGMRMGEVQDLQVQYVKDGYIQIEHAWIRRYGLDEPKWGSKRPVPIPSKTQLHLKDLIAMSPYSDPEDLVFWGVERKKPIDSKKINEVLYVAFEKIGISDELRRERNVTFHSWRHLFNSFLRTRVPDVKLQRITGHRTQEMTELYTTFRIEDFQDVLEIQEELF